MIVAHPDDETIWMGGTILANPQTKWTVLSLCRADDKDRAPKFRKVCRFLGAKAIIADLDDEEKLNLRESLPEIRWMLINFLLASRNRGSIHSSGRLTTTSRRDESLKATPSSSRLREFPRVKQEISFGSSEFDYVFTHGYNGEYGHPRHKGVSRVIREMVQRGEIKTKNLFNFSYQFDERKNLCLPEKADAYFSLSPALFKKKQKVINQIYGFRKSTFEYRTLTKIEYFKMIK